MDIRSREKGRVIILDLAGEMRLTEAVTPSLQKTVLEHIASGKKDILLNFEKVEFIDSYGIGDLLASYVTLKEKGGKLKIAGLPDKIWMILNYTGLTQVLETFDTEEKALRSFA